jgi:hypothetical protein
MQAEYTATGRRGAPVDCASPRAMRPAAACGLGAHATTALLLAAATALSGCYRYVPADPGRLTPGTAIRLRISAAETERLEAIRGSSERAVEGIVYGSAGGDLLLDTTVGTLDPRQGTRPLTQRLNVALSGIQEVELRQRDGMKTGAAIGVLAVATGIAVGAALGGGIGGPRDPVDPPVELRSRWRLPVFTIRF